MSSSVSVTAQANFSFLAPPCHRLTRLVRVSVVTVSARVSLVPDEQLYHVMVNTDASLARQAIAGRESILSS